MDYPILPIIASVTAIYIAFLPNDRFIIKTVGIIIYTLIAFRHSIKDFYLKHKKDDEHLKK